MLHIYFFCWLEVYLPGRLLGKLFDPNRQILLHMKSAKEQCNKGRLADYTQNSVEEE